MSKNDFDSFFIELNELIKSLNSGLKSIKVEAVLELMGFPPTCESIYIIQK
ncbi:MAG: hypothetical protein JXR62_05825 [Bacilli bacterium]|nr:hypothetical protein [Bacilli bacterium]